MLRTNLSTKPFYNIRAVQVALTALGVLVALMTLFNLIQLVRLTSSERALGARAQQAESDAQRLREEARSVRSQIDAKELGVVAAAAQEANAIIDLRAFSWSELFGQIESTLPEDVRLTSFQPTIDRDGRFLVNLRVQGRRVQALEQFIDALEKTGMFHQVLAAEEQASPEGLINALVQGEYTQPLPEPPTTTIGPPPHAREAYAVSDTSVGMLHRIVTEHRRAVYALAAGFVANLVVFAFLVYPLQSDVANVEQRTRSAEVSLAGAQAEFARANGTLTGKDRAVKELDTFYSSVLAQDLPGARRLTFSRLAQMADDANLDFERRKYEPVIERGSNLTRLKVTMNLAGDYADIRNFIHEIETSPEFVVIDNVALTEGTESEGALRLILELSTYFRNTEP